MRWSSSSTILRTMGSEKARDTVPSWLRSASFSVLPRTTNSRCCCIVGCSAPPASVPCSLLFCGPSSNNTLHSPIFWCRCSPCRDSSGSCPVDIEACSLLPTRPLHRWPFHPSSSPHLHHPQSPSVHRDHHCEWLIRGRVRLHGRRMQRHCRKHRGSAVQRPLSWCRLVE